jgi:subtilisin family serine protease
MPRAVITILFVLGMSLLHAQNRDCWMFLASSVLPQEVQVVDGKMEGYSVWFHAFAISDIQNPAVYETFQIDSMQCYSTDVFPCQLSRDTTDTTTGMVAESSFDTTGIISDAVDADSVWNIPNSGDWEISSSVEVKYEQLEMMQGYDWINEGFSGEGVTIAVLDAGFEGFLNDSAFQHIIETGSILNTYDFVKKDNDVFHSSSHGTQVMSCLAGMQKEDSTEVQYLGLAPCARYLLVRAEQSYSGRLVKEINFINALEWAVQQGADIITSSLIFGEQLYTRQQMNGQSLISQAAEKAYQQNVLVLNSAGNSDQNHWEILGAPGDAEHVLTIGACEWNGLKSSFSSVGPTSDWRAKPDLIARGLVFVTSNNRLSTESGTSFSCPLVAGFAACLMQLHPDWSAEKVRSELLQSATLYPYRDYAHGYGIPQAGYFLFPSDLPPADSATFHLEMMSDQVVEVVVHIAEEAVPQALDEALGEEADSGEGQDESDLLYVQLLDSLGRIVEYWAIVPEGKSGGLYDISGVPGGALKVYYKKYIQQMDFR